MNYIGKFISNFKEFYNDINSATLTGAIDVVVVQQEDGSYTFGKMGVLRSREKIVDIEVNGQIVDIHMKLGESGEAFFVEEVENGEGILGILATSPLPTLDLGDEVRKLHHRIHNESFSDLGHSRTSSLLPFSSGEDFIKSRSGTSETERSLEFTTSGEKAVQTDPLHTHKGVVLKPLNASKTNEENIQVSKSVDNEDKEKKMRKKRKRKAANARRRRSPSKDSSVSSTASESKSPRDVLHDEIFQMDVDGVDETDNIKSMSRTCSLPQLHCKNQESDESLDIELHLTNVEFVKRSHSYSTAYPRESHPFSDGDFSPVLSPMSSRPPSPKSDTEYERAIIKKSKTDAISQTEESEVQWLWGELPHVPTPPKSPEVEEKNELKMPIDSGIDDAVSQKSVLGGMFRFMRKTKKMRHRPQSEGIYLDDLNIDELSPEVAALYFPRRHGEPRNIQCHHDEDAESGNGPSLPHSPHSVEGAPCGAVSSGIDSDNEECRPIFFDMMRDYFDDISMSLCGGLIDENSEIQEEKFLHSIVTYDEFCTNPSVLFNPDLVFRINKKYYNWNSASPLIMSMVMFQQPLPAHTTSNLIKENMPKKPHRGYSSWFSWGRSAEKKQFQKSTEEEQLKINETEVSVETQTNRSPTIYDSNKATDATSVEEPINDEQSADRFKKSLRLSSDQINKLNLKDGANEVMFSVTTAYQGTTRCKCHIYLWKHSDTIVISDIDGTITKSDVLGHILPIIGKDWAQSGVAQLFTKIKRNGYQFLYLSARAIGQAPGTRSYLKNMRQGDLSLPEGPLLLSPTSLLTAFHTEVIVKNPEEFKKQCLSDIANLFPHKNPFYAGFGNKVNDTWAYAAVGIPISRIFTINPKGELRHELTISFQSSYSSLTDVSDHIFPPLPESSLSQFNKLAGTCAPDGRLDAVEFSSFAHWREPLPQIEDDDKLVIVRKTSMMKTAS
ncbi:Phosphatidate phosphatase LPIN2 [Nymphon striatum]|nr:Phosphatidate phosphatase LPIN2 [Nymphon striatum]